jgi:hypothetical protein
MAVKKGMTPEAGESCHAGFLPFTPVLLLARHAGWSVEHGSSCCAVWFCRQEQF